MKPVLLMRRIGTAVAITAALGLATVAQGQHTHEHPKATPSPAGKPGKSDPSHEMRHHMMAGMADMQKMKMHGDPDVDFAQMMAMHHQHGIEMAQVEVRDGKDEKMREMARKIIDAQEKERRELMEWLREKGHPME